MKAFAIWIWKFVNIVFSLCTWFLGADSGQISEETWNFLQSIYGGGPEVILRPPVVHVDPDAVQAEEKIEVETRSL